MGGISAGVGLISGIDSVSLIEQLLAVESRVKLPIQARIARLATAKSALLDVNSSLLGLQSSASAFRINSIFESISAISSGPDVVGVSATGRAQPGTYSFLVKQLATSSQYISRGFASRDASPLGLESFGVEFGNGRLAYDVPLSDLNGGDGVQRGIITITDRSGGSAEVDLSQATTVNEVVSLINATSGIRVEASISGDSLAINDLSGGLGNLVVSNGVGNTTASDLGIEGTVNDDLLLGNFVNRLGLDSSLSTLNGGLGVFIRDGVTDFVVTVDGQDFDIDLGRVNAPIAGDTLLSELDGGGGIAINDDPDQPDFTITASNGVAVDVDLGRVLDEDGLTVQDPVETVQDLIDRVNGVLAEEFGAGQVTMTINADADGFVLTDNLAGGSDLVVAGAGPGGSSTAEDLGILGTSTAGVLSGDVVINKVQTPRAQTIRDAAERILAQTGGLVELSENDKGIALQFTSNGGPISFGAGAPGFTGDPADIPERTLANLGFALDDSGVELLGERVMGGFGTVLLDQLNGGAGLGSASSLLVTDSEGNSLAIDFLNFESTLSGLMNTVNTRLANAGVEVRMSIDQAGSGVVFTDSADGDSDFTITGSMATALGLLDGDDPTTIASGNLEVQYVTQSSRLSELNYGRGVGTGTFRLTDSTGATATVRIDSDSDSLYDVMKLINTRGLEIRAEINATGDGIDLVDTTLENGATATSRMKVEDVSGTVASALRIGGESEEVGGDLRGSYAIRLDVDPTDTIDDLIDKLEQADAPITATVLNTGAGNAPWYLSLTSSISGTVGELLIDTDGVDLGLEELVAARDAEAFIGSTDPADALLVSAHQNELDFVVDGLSIDLLQASDQPVTITVERDEDSILAAVTEFTEAFNQVMSKINQYDSYDSETEVRGPLLGDSTVSLVRSRLYSTLQQRVQNVDGPYQYLSQVGIRLGSNGAIEFDEDKFRQAYESDPAAVEALFTAYDAQTSTTEVLEDIDPGISIQRDSTVYASLGFGDLFDQLLDDLTDASIGTVTLADQRFQTQIDSQTDRLELIDQRIEAKRERLQREFLAMETALAQLQSQQGALLSLGSSLNLRGGA
ncbi:MAG: flagellar filament capping protein FliD [Planctomycetota bacterium]|nr:flagellar filament capping protein FliD [Planctomycetota bacterium]